MHLLFVCTGNTCRSPMAAMLTMAKLQERGLGWTAESAGLYAAEGQPMTPLAQDALTRRHVPLKPHASRPLTRELAERADLILTMTASHAREAQARFPDLAGKIHALGAFVAGAEEAAEVHDILDPFGGSAEVYEACAAQLERLVERLVDKLAPAADETRGGVPAGAPADAAAEPAAGTAAAAGGAGVRPGQDETLEANRDESGDCERSRRLPPEGAPEADPDGAGRGV
ncbi:hypothetical protein GCM10010885_09620 [Alicyclobacillus cellulosilyticus]|uniref:Phosphotyrosine protein phosphatase I domain-containing protein n=1 Tax=Alicyclobacillus cellulosilyticus TaxID=1003997 RepID=A0A917K628_9BACL|nr:low molecular weight protein arginine phosphatase [Alicyclobacillus cellulosilyticus]GGJ02399.1 hypothetical protein GCM10010885_09620 [Alicyclobacillus cellulosilyticus]